MLSRTGIFHVLFALFFQKFTILTLPDFIHQTTLHSLQTIPPAHFVHR